MLSNLIQPSASGLLNQIKRQQAKLTSETDSQLRDRSMKLRYRALAGEANHKLLPEAFALVCEACQRAIGLMPYDVQIQGGIHMALGNVIEMETGQGKTLTATLPLYLFALYGRGSHLGTSNDYLASRDAETMRSVFGILGLTTGVIVENQNDVARRANYACDITYGTSSEFGFDFLRDRMKKRATTTGVGSGRQMDPVQRELFFILADEADALLIDEANTPLIIGAAGKIEASKQLIYQWASENAADAIENRHFKYRLREKKVELLKEGRQWIRRRLSESEFRCRSVLDLYEKFECAVMVHRDFHRDQHYLVRDGEIHLINESTGRLGEGRQWADGIHQAIQASEGLEVTPPTTHAAKLTIQGLFLSYQQLAGMTGTAVAGASELRKVYKKQVVSIPPRLPSRRQELPTLYFPSEAEKWVAICNEIFGLHRDGRPVLVGTRSVEKSDTLSRLLRASGIDHEVLNARQHDAEAQIIANAGREGRVTVATSMAGRGTDIKLSDEVVELGGLHVIVAELHDSSRQDRQLFGRCGRQGEPGTYRQYLSADDEILDLAYGCEEASRLRNSIQGDQTSLLMSAQDHLETRKRQNRLASLYQEKRQLRSIWEMGCDPLLDAM